MCKIVATTLVSNNAPIIADALRSVMALVDGFLIVDTGSNDNTVSIARRLAGKKLVTTDFDWQMDFAAARNQSLFVAAAMGFNWALTLDTDERLQFQDVKAIRERLISESKTDAWLVRDLKNGYSKERFIRIPSKHQWRGRTHEYLASDSESNRQMMNEVVFFEISKSRTDLQAKLKRDLEVLLEETAIHPRVARWWYFLGQTYEQQGDWQQAIVSFQRAVQLSSWREEVAWSIFCMARCYVQLDQLADAILACSEGLRIQHRSPELACLAAKCCLQVENYADAIVWGELAVQIGYLQMEAPTHTTRINFHFLPAWYEAPFEVLRTAYIQLGRLADGEFAAVKYHRALQQRLNYLRNN